MKKIVFLLAFVFLSSFAFAQDRGGLDTKTSHQEKENNSFYLGFGSGVDLTGSSWNSASVTYGLGGIADVFGGVQLDKNLSLQAEIQNFIAEGIYTTNIISQYNLRGLVEVKYAFSTPVCQPYLLAGGGLVYTLLNQASAYTTSVNADALGGLGLQFPVSSASAIFLEGKYNFILSSTTSFQDIPITAGIWTAF
jgi:Outer membrane protein beta-barrel domain